MSEQDVKDRYVSKVKEQAVARGKVPFGEREENQPSKRHSLRVMTTEREYALPYASKCFSYIDLSKTELYIEFYAASGSVKISVKGMNLKPLHEEVEAHLAEIIAADEGIALPASDSPIILSVIVELGG